MDISLDDYMRNKGSKRGRQNVAGRGRGRGRGGRGGMNPRQQAKQQNVNFRMNQQGVKSAGNRGGRGKKFNAGNRQITPKKTGNIGSRLGLKQSPFQRMQQKKLAMRIAANKNKKGITGNKQQGFNTKNIGNKSGKLDARLKLKLKITDARQKIQQKTKVQSQPSDARITIQYNLAKKKGLAAQNKKKQQQQQVTTPKNVANVSIPKIVVKNPQAKQQQNKGHLVTTKVADGSLIRTVDCRPPGQQGIPMRTINNKSAVSLSTSASPDSGEQLLIRTVNQQVRGGGRRRGRGRGGRGGVQITSRITQDVEMMEEEPMSSMTRSVPDLHRSIAKGSMLITTRGAPQPVVRAAPQTVTKIQSPVQYMEEDIPHIPYANTGQLFRGIPIAVPSSIPPPASLLRRTPSPYHEPAPPLSLSARLQPSRPKRPVVPAIDTVNDDEEVVISPLQGYKVQVTNLHPIVTQDDIIELFGAVGALKRARILKRGVAEVVFVNRDDAVLAVKKYHNRELDSLPMQLQLVTPLPSKNLSTPVFKLPKSSSSSAPEGPKEKIDIDMSVIQKALFRTSSTKDPGAPPPKPVTFTVKI